MDRALARFMIGNLSTGRMKQGPTIWNLKKICNLRIKTSGSFKAGIKNYYRNKKGCFQHQRLIFDTKLNQFVRVITKHKKIVLNSNNHIMRINLIQVSLRLIKFKIIRTCFILQVDIVDIRCSFHLQSSSCVRATEHFFLGLRLIYCRLFCHCQSKWKSVIALGR